MKAQITVWESERSMKVYVEDQNWFAVAPVDGYDGFVAQYDMNPHDLAEWNVLRERMLRAVEARQCIVVSG